MDIWQKIVESQKTGDGVGLQASMDDDGHNAIGGETWSYPTLCPDNEGNASRNLANRNLPKITKGLDLEKRPMIKIKMGEKWLKDY